MRRAGPTTAAAMAVLFACSVAWGQSALGGKAEVKPHARAVSTAAAPRVAPSASPEQRLIGIYQLIGKARMNDALEQVDALVRDVPHFRLAHLVRGDLLMARHGQLSGFAAGVPKLLGKTAERSESLEQMRQEASLRLQAIRETPPPDRIPRQFVTLAASTRHAIAVDTSRARLYLFEHRDGQLKLVSSHYASIGRSGVDKRVEGDRRTPLGVYFITSKLSKAQVDDFYGAGALPLNYPNDYDRGLGRTGSGIWLHGVPSGSYSRAPRVTDGCVALANEELDSILRTVEPRSTPVVIAERIDWVTPDELTEDRRNAVALLDAWNGARSDPQRLAGFYASRVVPVAQATNGGASRVSKAARGSSMAASGPTQLKDVSVLAWRDRKDVLVVTFGEVPRGARSGTVLRQYWERDGRTWRIVHERVIG
jgi:L,D-peptidoglycan transpeptidase YkuD (ErfK/YbiS/YcfS/YnhG family)